MQRRAPVAFQDWAPGVVRQILTVSLSPTPNKALIYLESLAKSMNYDDRSIDAQPREIVDQILMTILTMDELPNKMSVLQYLVRSFNTVVEEKRRNSIAVSSCYVTLIAYLLTFVLASRIRRSWSFWTSWASYWALILDYWSRCRTILDNGRRKTNQSSINAEL